MVEVVVRRHQHRVEHLDLEQPCQVEVVEGVEAKVEVLLVEAVELVCIELRGRQQLERRVGLLY